MRMSLAAGLLAGCGGATTIAAAPPVATTRPPPPAMCAYTGELGDLGLVTPRGTSFAYVQAMTGTATFESEATDLPRLMVDVAQDGVRLRGPADLANPAPLRLVLGLELAPGVHARPGAGPRLVEANPSR